LHLEVCRKRPPQGNYLRGQPAREHEIDKAKASGAKVLVFASTDALAKRMINHGVDGLLLEG